MHLTVVGSDTNIFKTKKANLPLADIVLKALGSTEEQVQCAIDQLRTILKFKKMTSRPVSELSEYYGDRDERDLLFVLTLNHSSLRAGRGPCLSEDFYQLTEEYLELQKAQSEASEEDI